MLTTATKAKSGFYIGVSCPGCGARLELDGDFFVLTCQYCDSGLRVVLPDTPPAFVVQGKHDRRQLRFHVDRYLKENDLPLTSGMLQIKNLYYPFWKINGRLLKLRNRKQSRVIAGSDQYQEETEVVSQKTDISIIPYELTVPAGRPVSGLPQTLGFRTSYISADPFAAENLQKDFDCMDVTCSLESAHEMADAAIGIIDATSTADFGKNHTELLVPEYSLVYFPFHLIENYAKGGRSRFIVDGLSGRVVHHLQPKLISSEPEQAESEFNSTQPVLFEPGKLGVEMHRCPTCGVDLPANQSYFYICGNCHEPVFLDGSGHSRIEASVVIGSQSENDSHFPFWSYEIPEDQMALIGRLFGGIFKSDRLVVPAFRMHNYDAMYRLAKRLSAAIPKLTLEQLSSTDARYASVSLRPEEGLATAETLILRDMLGKGERVSSADVKFTPRSQSLIYAPFHPESYFYVDSVLGSVTFEKSAVD